jgi:hypothetical protein
MDAKSRFELLMLVHRRLADSSSPTDVMIAAEALSEWIESRRFPEQPTACCTADYRLGEDQSRLLAERSAHSLHE